MPLTIVYAPDTALLIPGLVPAEVDALAAVRTSVTSAIRAAEVPSDRDGVVVVLVPGRRTAVMDGVTGELSALGIPEALSPTGLNPDPGERGRVGSDPESPRPVGFDPLDLRPARTSAAVVVARSLLAAAGISASTTVVTVDPTGSPGDLDRLLSARGAAVPQLILALGSGTARRDDSSPLAPCADAIGLDAALLAAFASGHGRELATVLTGIEPKIAADLGLTGRAPWLAALAVPFDAVPAAESQPARVDRAELDTTHGVGYFTAVWTVTGDESTPERSESATREGAGAAEAIA